MQWQQDLLVVLQRQLKKEFLLVEKEQQEKVKLKRQIEELTRNYHAMIIETEHKNNVLLKDQGFENCYNFIKDVIVGISSNQQVGSQILTLAQSRSTLIPLLTNSFYESLQTNDPEAKDITRFLHMLLPQLTAEITQSQAEKVIEVWKLYMNKPDHQHYFQQFAKQTLQELLRQRPNKRDKDYILQINDRKKLAEQFLGKITIQSALCPPSIKLPLKGMTDHLIGHKTKQIWVWKMISSFYLHPFISLTKQKLLQNKNKQKILQFVTQLTSKYRFCSELSYQILIKPTVNETQKYCQQIQTICSNLMVTPQNYAVFKNMEKNQNQKTIQIKLVGACLSLSQLHELLVLINGHRQIFSKISEKVASRAQKIFEMSPNLQFLKRQQQDRLFVSIVQLRYEQSISSDYYKTYTNIYRDDTTKQMLKTVLVELQNCMNICPDSSRKTLPEMFQIILNHSQGVYALSAPLQMKVKYLLYLLNKPQNKHIKSTIIEEMRQQLSQRQIINTQLFEDTKFSLFKVYSNLRSLKLRHKKYHSSIRQADAKLHLIKKLQQLKIDLCVTSRASRNCEDQNYDRYRYRLASADDIVVSSVQQCIHKQNCFTGTNSHGSNVMKIIKLFSNLAQIKHFIHFPSFTTHQQKHHFSYCNKLKIGEAFRNILKIIEEKMNMTSEENSILQDILYRYLSELLLGEGHSPSFGPRDRMLSEKIQEKRQPRVLIDAENPPLRRESPVKRGESPNRRLSRESTRKRRGSHSDIDSFINSESICKTFDSGIRSQQLVQIGARYIMSMSVEFVPHDKMRKLREMLQIYRLMRGKQEDDLEEYLVEVILAARPINLVSTLSYLQTFLPDQKLMSSEGKIIKQLQKAVLSIVGNFERTNRFCQRSWIAEC